MSVTKAILSAPWISAGVALAAFIVYGILENYGFIPGRSIIKNLPSAGRGHWLTGHFPECFSVDPDIFSLDCFHTLGPVHVIRGILGKKRIVIQDPKALSHLIRNAYDYPKTSIVRGEIGRGIGHGVLWEEGDNHKRQRKMLNPAFSQANIRSLAPVFTALALQLATQIDAMLDSNTSDVDPSMFPYGLEKNDGVVLECYHWFFRVALDAIGIGGFSRDYGSIHDENQGVARVFSLWAKDETLDLSVKGIFQRLAYLILPRNTPFLNNPRLEIIDEMTAVLDKDARDMCDERREYLKDGGEHAHEDLKRDVFTILMKGNMAASGRDKLSDTEVFDQIKTFLFAGHETSSTGLSWTFHLLSKYPETQDKLREEVLKAKKEAEESGLDNISPDVIETLPYLDAVMREVLRFRPSIPGRSFEAQKDDILPLSQPITLTNGRVITEVPVKKGQEIYTWHTVTNKRSDVWGEDSLRFRPERWIEDPDVGKSGELKGAALYGQMMSFFGGPRSCIGYRFALAEMKAIIAVLVERFVFHDVGLNMSARTLIVMRPCVEDQHGEMKNQMPLRLTRVKAQ